MDDHRFTDREWAEVRLLPSALCWLIAAADGRFDTHELRELSRAATEANAGSAVLGRIASQHHESTAVRIPTSWGREQLDAYFERVRRTLGRHLSSEEFDEMAKALWRACWQVAEVAGITAEESVVLGKVRTYLWFDR